MARIVNFHHYGRDKAKLTAEFGADWLYVGRQNAALELERSPLANPFSNKESAAASLSADPIADYKRWLWRQMNRKETAVIQALESIGPDTALVCWCAPKSCHAEVIIAAAEWWQQRTAEAQCTEIITVALSIRQPWAWLITRPDLSDEERAEGYENGRVKDIENRDWRTNHRGWFFVHAAQKFDHVGYRYILARYPDIRLPASSDFERGGIVGQANLVDVVEESKSRWFIGQYGFVLRGARPLPFTPCRGKLNFFQVDADVSRQQQAGRQGSQLPPPSSV